MTTITKFEPITLIVYTSALLMNCLPFHLIVPIFNLCMYVPGTLIEERPKVEAWLDWYLDQSLFL